MKSSMNIPAPSPSGEGWGEGLSDSNFYQRLSWLTTRLFRKKRRAKLRTLSPSPPPNGRGERHIS